MKTLISEIFLVFLVILFAGFGVFYFLTSVTSGFEEVETALEDRKLNKQVFSKLKAATSSQLRSVAMEVLLWDLLAYHDFLQNKSMLPDSQKRAQIEECRRKLSGEHARQFARLQGMTDRQVFKSLKSQILDRNAAWRRNLLSRLERDSEFA